MVFQWVSFNVCIIWVYVLIIFVYFLLLFSFISSKHSQIVSETDMFYSLLMLSVCVRFLQQYIHSSSLLSFSSIAIFQSFVIKYN